MKGDYCYNILTKKERFTMKNELNKIFERVLESAAVIDFASNNETVISINKDEVLKEMLRDMTSAISQITIVTQDNVSVDTVNDLLSESADGDIVPFDFEVSDTVLDEANNPTLSNVYFSDEVDPFLAIDGFSLNTNIDTGLKVVSQKKQAKLDKKNEKRIRKLNNEVLSYSDKRNFINKILRSGEDLTFNYTKVDNSVRSVVVSWNDDYNYDIPDENSDFTYLYDSEAGIFKHFKLDKIVDIEILRPF